MSDTSARPPAPAENHRLLALARLFTMAAVFAPLVVAGCCLSPFTEAKYYFFRACVEIAGILLVVSCLCARNGRQTAVSLRHLATLPLARALAAYVVAVCAATTTALDPARAFWSSLPRGDGAFQILHYAAFFVLCALLFRTRQQWHRLFLGAVAAALGTVIYGALSAIVVTTLNGGTESAFGLLGPYSANSGTAFPLHPFKTLLQGSRFEGSLGNPAFAGSYYLLVLPLILLLGPGRFSAALKIVAALFVGGALVLTDSRAALLGLACGGIVYAMINAVRKIQIRPAVAALVCASIVTVVGFSAKLMTASSPEFRGTRAFTSNLTDISIQSRLSIWKIALSSALEHPLLGVGPENFGTIYDAHFPPHSYQPGSSQETWQDKAHNIFLDRLSETGLIGLAAYLAAILCFATAIRQCAKTGADQIHKDKLAAVLPAALVAYMANGFFVFDTICTYLPITLMLAYVTAAVCDTRYQSLGKGNRSAILTGGSILATTLLALAFWFGNFQPLSKSIAYIAYRDGVVAKKEKHFFINGTRVLNMQSPFGQSDIIQDFVWTLAAPVVQNAPSIERSKKTLAFLTTYKAPLLSKPTNADYCINAYELGMLNMMLFLRTNEQIYADSARDAFAKGHEAAPTRPEFLFGLYDVNRMTGESEQAEPLKEQIDSLWPGYLK